MTPMEQSLWSSERSTRTRSEQVRNVRVLGCLVHIEDPGQRRYAGFDLRETQVGQAGNPASAYSRKNHLSIATDMKALTPTSINSRNANLQP